MLLTCKELEKRLIKSDSFVPLKPRFVLIGSIPEGTRLKPATELDLTCPLLTETEQHDFYVRHDDPFNLYANNNNDDHPAKEFIEHGKLNYEKLFVVFMTTLKKLLFEMKDWIETNTNKRLSTGSAEMFCEKCQLIANRYKGLYYQHCKNCKFSVTHTKMGACLIFTC